MKDLTRRGLARGSTKRTRDHLEILRILAHELSQPLTSLRGSVEVALMGELDEVECRRAAEVRFALVFPCLKELLAWPFVKRARLAKLKL